MKRPRIPASPYDAIVGVSMNSEMDLVIEETAGPKKILRSMGCCLSGSTGNTGTAIHVLGGRPHLIGLVGVNSQEELAGKLLHDAVSGSGIPFIPISVLDHTNFAAIPVVGDKNGEVWGRKGQIVHSSVPEALKILAGPEIGIGLQTFVVITGLRAVEIPFAKALLSKAQPGFRVLNAKDTLCASKEFKKILPLVDLLVLNQREFEETGMRFSDLHSCGPRVVLVTQDENGGMFSFSSGHQGSFAPVSFLGGHFETGAGDWFLGALISELIRLKQSVSFIGLYQFEEVIIFAARVAGKKVTIPGGGNGPSRHQLR